MTQTPKRINGTRFAIALVCGLLSSIGIIFCFVFMLSNIMTSPGLGISAFLGVGLYAWTALAVMTLAWVRDEPVSLYWAIPGTIAGLCCSIVCMWFFPFYFSASILGCYLSYFHLRKKRPGGCTESSTA
jgi:hypothetical protein